MVPLFPLSHAYLSPNSILMGTIDNIGTVGATGQNLTSALSNQSNTVGMGMGMGTGIHNGLYGGLCKAHP